MLIDTHAHLNFRDFDKDWKEVISKTLKEDIYLVNASSNYNTSKKAIEIAESFSSGVYAAIGLHPINIKQGDLLDQSNRPEDVLEKDFDYEKYKSLAKSEKMVAIGEIGLDYLRKPKTKTKLTLFKGKQKEILLKQLKLAKEINLPVIFHCRMAHQDLLKILDEIKKEWGNQAIKGVIHCFTGDWEQAKKYLDMGFYLGFNGIIFKLDLDEVIKKTSMDKILIETDCPFLTPPEAESQRNQPLYVKYVAQKIAEIKGESFEKIAEITFKNAKNLFKL